MTEERDPSHGGAEETDRAESPEGESGEPEEELRDLGFGQRVARESRRRLMNRDGSFNVERRGIPRLRTASVYGLLLRIEWWQFYLLVAAAYVAVNLVFAGGYLAVGSEAIGRAGEGPWTERYLQAFFFSVQTLTTVGYGRLAPASLGANLLATTEALIGLGGFAVVAAVFFARMAHPQPSIEFSDHAVIAPYGEDTGFELRVVNRSRDELVRVRAEVVYSHLDVRRGELTRCFHRLELERRRIAFFPLHWTVVHPIGETSPLQGKGPEELLQEDAEFLVQISAVDETHAETVHARTSYRADEILWGKRFTDIYERTSDGMLGINVGRIHETEDAGAGEPRVEQATASDPGS